MAIKKFKAVVTKIYDFEVEFNDEVWNEKNIAEWKKTFYEADTLEEVAEIFASMFANQGEGEFLEGFGVPMINGSVPFPQILTAKGCKQVTNDINVIGFSEDEEIEVEEVE